MSERDDPIGPVFAALADPTRRLLLRSLADGDGATATQLAADLPISRQAVTKHLAALEEAGLVSAERTGREVRYQVTPKPMAEAAGWMVDLGSEWDERLEALRRHLGGAPPAG